MSGEESWNKDSEMLECIKTLLPPETAIGLNIVDIISNVESLHDKIKSMVYYRLCVDITLTEIEDDILRMKASVYPKQHLELYEEAAYKAFTLNGRRFSRVYVLQQELKAMINDYHSFFDQYAMFLNKLFRTGNADGSYFSRLNTSNEVLDHIISDLKVNQNYKYLTALCNVMKHQYDVNIINLIFDIGNFAVKPMAIKQFVRNNNDFDQKPIREFIEETHNMVWEFLIKSTSEIKTLILTDNLKPNNTVIIHHPSYLNADSNGMLRYPLFGEQKHRDKSVFISFQADGKVGTVSIFVDAIPSVRDGDKVNILFVNGSIEKPSKMTMNIDVLVYNHITVIGILRKTRERKRGLNSKLDSLSHDEYIYEEYKGNNNSTF